MGQLIINIVSWAFTLAIWIIFVRIVIDWIRVFAPQWTPPRALVVIFEVIFSITDPPLEALRRVIPPIRLGQVMLDLSPMILIIGLIIVQGITLSIIRTFV